MREGVGNYLAPAKEFYGEGATGFGVSGPRGLLGDGHGGGGQQVDLRGSMMMAIIHKL